MREDPLALDSRRTIFNAIRLNPGIHFRELSRLVGMQAGQLTYHINYLEERELVVKKHEGQNLRLFITKTFTQQQIKMMFFLRKEPTRAVIMLLLDNPDLSHGQILESIDMTGATLSYHLKRMLEETVLVKTEAKNPTYRVADEENIRKLLIAYRVTLLDHLLDSV